MNPLILFFSTHLTTLSPHWISKLARYEHPRYSRFLLFALCHFAAQTMLVFFTDPILNGILLGIHGLFITCLVVLYFAIAMRNRAISGLLCIAWLNAYCVTVVAMLGNTIAITWIFYGQIGATLIIISLKMLTNASFATDKQYFFLFLLKTMTFIVPPVVCLYLENQPLLTFLTSLSQHEISASSTIVLFQGFLHGVAVLYFFAFLKPLLFSFIKTKLIESVPQETCVLNNVTQDLAQSPVQITPSNQANHHTQSKPSAHYLDQVSILFADMANFSALMQHHATEQVVAFLHDVFNEFDELCTEFGVAKIKTAGDQYMAAAGVPFPHTRHASHCCLLALAMRARFSTICRKHKMHTALRIGISSGSVVAGFVGNDKRSYDLWGDDVNLAARMESSGAANKIQLSHSTYQLVSKQFNFEPVRHIPIKGFGITRCHYLKEFSNETQSRRHKFLATILAKAT